MKTIVTAITAALLACPALAADITSSVTAADVPEKERTKLGLYLTSQEAATALSANPDIVFVDVRDPVEVMFVGHPDPVDAVVPFRFVSYTYNAKRGAYGMDPNPAFVDEVNAVMERLGRSPSDPVFVSCQTGGRTARAVDALTAAGYTQVYALFEGIEGDLNAETGRRDINGWKNAGLPWSYKLTPEVAWHPPK